jgi:hypothetical protein
VGDDDSLDVFYRSVGRQQMGWERMRPTEMVNLQCISFGIEEKLRVEMVEGGGGQATNLAFQKRRGESMAQWREAESAMWWWPLRGNATSRGGR